MVIRQGITSTQLDHRSVGLFLALAIMPACCQLNPFLTWWRNVWVSVRASDYIELIQCSVGSLLLTGAAPNLQSLQAEVKTREYVCALS